MMQAGPSCGELVFSWVMILAGSTLMCLYGHFGLVLAFVPFGIAQRIRGSHDRASLEDYKQSAACKVFALVYYIALLVAAAVAVTHGVHLIDLPNGLLLVAFFFPFIVGMLAADHAACSEHAARRPRGSASGK